MSEAWALFGLDRSLTSWPAVLRLSDALNVAKRTSLSTRFASPGGDAWVGAARPAPKPAQSAVTAAATRRRTGFGDVVRMRATLRRWPRQRHEQPANTCSP